MLPPQKDVQERLAPESVGYALDPVLTRKGCDFGACLSDLVCVGIAEQADEVREECGLFFVKRKDDKLRLIFDTRRSNAHLKDPMFT